MHWAGTWAWNVIVKQAHTCSVVLGSQRQEAAKKCVRGKKGRQAGREAGGAGEGVMGWRGAIGGEEECAG